MATITDTWTEISTAGVILQKHGSHRLSLAYANDLGSIADDFSVSERTAQLFPAVTGKTIFARAPAGKVVSITAVILDS
jgi:hypothetical protein